MSKPLKKYWIGIDPCPDEKAHKGLRDNGTAIYLAADVEQELKEAIQYYTNEADGALKHKNDEVYVESNGAARAIRSILAMMKGE